MFTSSFSVFDRKSSSRSLFVFSFIFCGTILMGKAHALTPAPVVSEFYSVSDIQKEQNESELPYLGEFDTPGIDIFWQDIQAALELGARVYSLLSFDRHKGNYGDVLEPYNRLKHFKGWTYPEGDCRNTRALVLTETSEVSVKMSSSGCTVYSGKWSDPYSGKSFSKAQDLQIDHFVPLKNAYISGADRWGFYRRCLYANYQGNNFHLLPVLGTENTKKSDRTPEMYMPPNRAYACTYLVQWLKVKLIWALELSSTEKEKIEDLAKAHNCRAAEFVFTDVELENQRRQIAQSEDLCR